jgi:hypothetical protein
VASCLPASGTRIGAAPSNFAKSLEPADADLAQQIAKDPYVLDWTFST